MKARSFFLVGLLCGSALLAPFAQAGELTLFTFITPGGRGVGERIEIFIEVYRYTELFDPDEMRVAVGQPHPYDLVVQHNGTGRYYTTYTIQAADVDSGGVLDVDYHARVGTTGWSQNSPYGVANAGGGSGGTSVVARLANPEVVGPSADPGETLEVEARTFVNGSLRDGGVLNATLQAAGGFTHVENLTLRRLGEGIYRVNYTVPSNLTNTTVISFFFTVGPPGFYAFPSVRFIVEPLPAYVRVVRASPSQGAVEILAGGAQPADGAAVSIWGYVAYPPYGFDVLSTVNGTTDSKGSARVLFPLPENLSSGLLLVNVTSGSLTHYTPLILDPALLTEGWTPDPPQGTGFLCWLVTDPYPYERGDTAVLKIHVTQSYAPLASTSVSYYLWRGSQATVLKAANATTDATGNLTVTYGIPQDWAKGETLVVRVDGATAFASHTINVNFEPPDPSGTSDLRLENGGGAVGSPLTVRAVYGGQHPTEGAMGVAYLLPGNSTRGLASTLGALPSVPASSVLLQEGLVFAGSIQIPAWYPEGDYLLVVGVTNNAATARASDQFSTGNFTVVHVGPAGSLALKSTTSGGFLPGLPAFGLVAAFGAAAAAARRRNRA